MVGAAMPAGPGRVGLSATCPGRALPATGPVARIDWRAGLHAQEKPDRERCSGAKLGLVRAACHPFGRSRFSLIKIPVRKIEKAEERVHNISLFNGFPT